MERKFAIPLLSFLAGILVMLIAWHLLAAGAATVSAQAASPGTDQGPSWTVTPVVWGDANRQYIVVVAESDKDFVGMARKNMRQLPSVKNMALYRLNPLSNKTEIEFIGARTIEYDLMMPVTADVKNHANWRVFDVAHEVEEAMRKYR